MSTIDPAMRDMLDVFVHETETMLEQLDDILLVSEREKSISDDNIGSIFRITHTIKGSAAMMSFEGISELAHAVEDVFYILRDAPEKLNIIFDSIFDLVFQTSDFLKKEVEKIQESDGEYQEDSPDALIKQLRSQAALLKGEAAPESPRSKSTAESNVQPGEGELCVHVFFADDCQMENMRAFMLMTQLKNACISLRSEPENPERDSTCSETIIKNGFYIYCRPADSVDEIRQVIESALNIKSYEILEASAPAVSGGEAKPTQGAAGVGEREALADVSATPAQVAGKPAAKSTKQSLISVNQSKLDQLMDLVGEIVTAESMVARNPDLLGLRLDNFSKSFRELRKLTDELQDVVMAIRMVPLQGTFHKMDRIVRDMSKKLEKKAELIMAGGDTEVDKTINDAIVDPLMHMVRNSMDHAIEDPEDRRKAGKSETGKITLSARNVGGEILIDVSDDGCGLDAEKLLAKAEKSGILTKPASAYSEKEAFGLIMLAGFSTNTQVTEFSGRGVGMDVVRKNIEQVGGTISINSTKGQGTTFTIKIPLTLAIVDGMNIAVGDTVFTLPIASISQSFKITSSDQVFCSTNGMEMIMLRGECYPIVRLNQFFGIRGEYQDVMDGIMILVESTQSKVCFFADQLLGEYQVVVKPFPGFFGKYDLKRRGLSGCSILGDGSISLIMDASSLIDEL